MLKVFSRVQTAMFACLFTLTFAAFVFGQTKNLQNDLQRSFKKFSLVKVNNQTARKKAETGDALTITTAERTFQLNLTPRDLRSSAFRAEETDANGLRAIETEAAITTFAGKVAGEENNSEVRVSIDAARGGIEGYFISNGEMFFVEPARHYTNAASSEDSVVYRAEDAMNQAGFSCAVEEKIERGREMVNAANALQSPQANLRAVELATEADFEFVTQLGGAAQANAEILNILNMVEGIYRTELSLTISVVYQHAWTTADPFTPISTTTLLTSFRDYWNTNFPTTNIPRDAAHLFTGKPAFSGQGLAYLGVVCKSPSAAYGFDGRLNFAPIKFELTAHEIGHNLGATHVETAQSCGNTIMNAMITQNTQFTFCAYSRNEITTYVSANNSCMSAQVTDKTPFDFDFDMRADLSVFRPSTGVWFQLNSTTGVYGTQFGANGDKPVAADYDADGKTDIAVYRGGLWFRFKSATNTYDGFGFGVSTDLPVPADFDGDGKADVAVFRPSTGEWFVSKSRDNAFQSIQFGVSGDRPLPADYDADGKADFNLWRPSDNTWYRLNSGSNLSFSANQFGTNGDKPVVADFDNDNRADLAVYRPSVGVWYIIRSSDNGYYGVGFGLAQDIPVAADYDGDGKDDIAVYRPSDGYWYRLNSRDGAFASTQFGAPGDIPVPANQNQ